MKLETPKLYNFIERRNHQRVLDKITTIISILNCEIVAHSFRSVSHNINRLFNDISFRRQISDTGYHNQIQTVMIMLAVARLANGILRTGFFNPGNIPAY